MDTRINSSDSHFALFISPRELESLLGQTDSPLLLDVRPQARFDASPRMLEEARHCSLDEVPALASAMFAANPHQAVIAYCVYGHHVSANAAAVCRAAGLKAYALAGGFEGGEDGIDSVQGIALWRATVLKTVSKPDGLSTVAATHKGSDAAAEKGKT